MSEGEPNRHERGVAAPIEGSPSGYLDRHAGRDCSANGVADRRVPLGRTDDLPKPICRCFTGGDRHPHARGLRARRHIRSGPEHSSIVREALDRDLEPGQGDTQLRGPHRDPGGVAVRQGRSQKPTGRRRASAATYALGHVADQDGSVGALGPAHQAALQGDVPAQSAPVEGRAQRSWRTRRGPSGWPARRILLAQSYGDESR